ncbi:MAG: twin-arginine translocation signal domain-containing protein [Bacteroidia bacterium]|nr:twin-arginine translocation signal domain-containing protein [Bacteroidia bacterium]
MSRRNFIKLSGLVAGALAFPIIDTVDAANGSKRSNSLRKSTLKLRFKPYELQLKHVFTIATSSRTTTPVMLVEVEYDGLIGYGEASMPPYLGESHKSVAEFLNKVDLSAFHDPFELETILAYIDGIDKGNYAAKASVDIALHDLLGKMLQKPWHKLWGLDATKTPNTSFTIGIDTPEVVKGKVKEASEFKILKVKLGRETDKEMIQAIRSITDVPICVDVNQGWKDRNMALDMIHWLAERGVVFVEQPMSKYAIDDMAWLTEHSPLPTMADEAVQTIYDVLATHKVYSGINIKLMKCGGMRNAHKMANMAKTMGMKVMVGCMTETSCAISAAAQLAPLADWADLDGNLLINNDLYNGVTIVNGKVTLNELPGIGIQLKHA